MKPKMYISLPMTGIENLNLNLEMNAFHVARKMGYWVFSPSHLAKAVERIMEDHGEEPLYQHYLGYDLWSLSRCDAMLLCPGWENSKGCQIEVRFAVENNIPVYDYNDGMQICVSNLMMGLKGKEVTELLTCIIQKKSFPEKLFTWNTIIPILILIFFIIISIIKE